MMSGRPIFITSQAATATERRGTPYGGNGEDAPPPAAGTDDLPVGAEEFSDFARRARRTLRRRRRSGKDIRQVDAEWFAPVLDRWLAELDGDHGGAGDARFLALLAVSMDEVLSMRDAIVISLVGRASREELMDVAAKPHARRTGALVGRLLGASFDDPTLKPDLDRCDRGLQILLRIVHADDGRLSAQPLTVMSYVLWWSGGATQAMGCALRALAVDDECSLARILVDTLINGVAPAWLAAGAKSAAGEWECADSDCPCKGVPARSECCACAEGAERGEAGCGCGECHADGAAPGATAHGTVT